LALKKNQTLNFIDVFSGAGGFSAGLEMAGLKCILGIDFDKYATQTFARNHKHAEVYCGDVSKLSSAKLKTLLKGQQVDAVVGGPPCQGFSTVGLGNPEDQRNSLFLQFIRLVKLTKPSFVVVENVTGLLAKKNEETLKAIFKKFDQLGYKMDVQVMSAQNYGVPEMRRRTILIGTKLNADVRFPDFTHTEKNWPTVGLALKDLKSPSGDIFNHDLEAAVPKCQLDLARLKHVPEGRGIRYEKDEKELLPKSLQLKINWKEVRENRLRQAKYFRLDRKKPSPTIMTHRQSYYHPTENRYLTQREAARIQSFPNDFVFEGPVSAQWRQIGNAVPPLMGKSIGLALKAMLAESFKTKKKDLSKSKKKSTEGENILVFRKKAFVYREPNQGQKTPVSARSKIS